MRASKDILLVHPGKQHAYEVAAALQERGRLLQFVTSIYDAPDSSFAALARTSSMFVGRDAVERELAKRRHPAIDPRNVTPWPLAEVVSRTVGRVRVVQALTGGRSGYPFANWACDTAVARALRRGRWRPEAVYAFLGAARHTFDACRELGIRTILDVPIILTAGDILARERQILGLKPTKRTVSTSHLNLEIQAAEHIIAPSRAVALSVPSQGCRAQISEVPFGVDLDTFRPSPQAGPTDPFRMVYAGRLELRKGVHYLVRAWKEAGSPGELVLAGPPGESDYMRLLRRDYDPSVKEAGNLTKPALARVLSGAHAFVMPSLAEGSALVSYEALASGLPSLVTHETGSVVRHGIEGFVVAARDSTALASRIRDLHDNPGLRRQMSLAARARAEEFSWPAYGRRLVAAIDSAVASNQLVNSAIA